MAGTSLITPVAEHLPRAEVVQILRGFIKDWAMDPYDAGEILSDIDADGIDRATLADRLDGAGYPNLVTQVLTAA